MYELLAGGRSWQELVSGPLPREVIAVRGLHVCVVTGDDHENFF